MAANDMQTELFYNTLAGILEQALAVGVGQPGHVEEHRVRDLQEAMDQAEHIAPLPTVAGWLLGYPLLFWFCGGIQVAYPPSCVNVGGHCMRRHADLWVKL